MTEVRKSRYTDEFKAAAVARLNAGEKRNELAKELKVAADSLTTWKQQAAGITVNKSGTRNFSDEFKRATVQRIKNGERLVSVADDIKVAKSVLYGWLRQHSDGHAVVAKKANGKTVSQDLLPKEVRVTNTQDAIVWLRKARKAMEKRGAAAAFDDPVCQFAMLALQTLEGKI